MLTAVSVYDTGLVVDKRNISATRGLLSIHAQELLDSILAGEAMLAK